MQPNQEEIAHFLWCLLVAVRTAEENHEIKSETGKRKFIAQWLRGARRHDAFRGMTSEFQTVRQLLEKDLSSPIEGILNTLWMNAVSSTSCDLFRFRAVLNSLNSHGWRHSLCPWPEHVTSELLDRQKSRSNHILQLGVSLDIENYCTLRLFFDLSTLAGLSRRNLPEDGIRLLFQM